MEVILLEKIHKLGELGDKVRVKPGYGRNYLIPQKKAVPATAANVEKFEVERAELQTAQASAFVEAQSRVEQMQDLQVSIAAKAGSEGKLYGSIGTAEIAAAVSAAGHAVEKREVRLPDGPLRETGEHVVDLHFHADVDVKVTVTVVPDEKSEATDD
jgi:large subunit ribosomal protein L9